MKRRSFLKATLAGAALTTAGASLPGNLFSATEAKELLALAGTRALSPGYYTRKFREGKLADENLEAGLRELAKTMQAAPDPARRSESDVSAGYTYLGQFIDHDLTLDLSPLANPQSEAANIPNFRTPFLDLDQLYGGGPNLSPFLYYKPGNDSRPGAERFLIGMTTGGKSREDDLPRNSQGLALTGDPRQDENLILAQLHVAFLKLHNIVVADSNILNGSPHYRRKGDSDFAAAQRVVTWHYQWLVRNDYLKKILEPTVFAGLQEREKLELANPPSNFQIPIEFSAAAFRFGHSMVRDEYQYNDVQDSAHQGVKLKDLFDHTGATEGFISLSRDWIISWDRFFEQSNQASLNRAQKIDTKIAGGLYNLPFKMTKQFSVAMHGEHAEPALPARTLLRGARMRLPSGQAVAKELRVEALEPDQIITGEDVELFKRYRFHEETPLWYYILKEAELSNEDKECDRPNEDEECDSLNHKKCDRLGPVGSRIVAGVIIDALAADPNSYLRVNPKWEPTIKPPGNCPLNMGRLLGFIHSHHSR